MKVIAMNNRGETLVVVPCWWDGALQSLAATVRLKRNDLLKDFESTLCAPIPPEPPPGYFKVDAVPGFGELMLASNPSSPHFDPTFWWLSEKYDGVRAFFNPYTRVVYLTILDLYESTTQRYSRTGKIQTLPLPFYSALPSVVIDGEIWFGRGNFLEAHKIAAASELQKSIDWSFLRVVAFDNPDLEPDLPTATAEASDLVEEKEDKSMKKATLFEVRYKRLLAKIENNHVVEIALSIFCKHRAMLHQLLEKVLDVAGEGMVARKNRSIYIHGRSDMLLKFKSNRDQEGLVVDKKGMFYDLKLPSNEIIRAVRSPNMAGDPPKIGELVTFVYFQHSKKTGSPTWAQIQVIRHDMTWQEAVYNFRFNTLPRRPQVTTTSQNILNQFSAPFLSRTTKRPSGYFSTGANGNIRKFFDAFARARGLDPLHPESWYKITASQIEAVKHGYAVVKHYDRSVSSMLIDTYPDIGLEKSRFRFKPLKYWTLVSNQRILFDQLARSKGLDPLKPATWYSLRRGDFLRRWNAKRIIQKYDSYRHCVTVLYPELNLEDHRFITYAAAIRGSSDQNNNQHLNG